MNYYDVSYAKLQEGKLLSIIKGDLTVTQVARDFNKTRQSIHSWLRNYKEFGVQGLIPKKRGGHSNAPYNKTSKAMEDIVIDLAKRYWQDGVETLHDRLEFENNITLNPSTIFRILKRKNIRYGDNYYLTQRNHRTKLYSHATAGKEVQMDTTYPFGYKEGKVIYTAIDDATRMVYMYAYETANAQNTLYFIKKLQRKFPFTILKIRTDQGTEFKNKAVSQLLKEQEIEHRCNTPYSPEENGKIERFHRTLNDKCLPFGFYPLMTLDSMSYRLQLFLFYYNNVKKHRGLNMNGMTPMQKLIESQGSVK